MIRARAACWGGDDGGRVPPRSPRAAPAGRRRTARQRPPANAGSAPRRSRHARRGQHRLPRPARAGPRHPKPSPSVIAALADALRLDDGQRRQLYTLAMVSQRGTVPSGPPAGPRRGADSDGAPRAARHDAGVRRRPGQRRARVERRVGSARPPARNARRCGAEPRPPRVPAPRTRERCTPTGSPRPTSRSAACAPPPAGGVTIKDFAALMDELRAAPDFNERWSSFATTEKRRGYDAHRAPRPRPTAPQLRGAPPPR